MTELALRVVGLAGQPGGLKRAMDLVLATGLLVVFAPLMGVVSGAIRLMSPGPALFAQRRVGQHGQEFVLWKFRTMHRGCDEAPHATYVREWIGAGEASADGMYKLDGDARVFRFGGWLRRTGLDELPQLFNVLRGDMSLVGPRPALPYEVELYKPNHRRRLDGRPGLTGAWQVSGRNRVSFERMVELDLDYIDRWSLGRDIVILLKTPRAMLGGR